MDGGNLVHLYSPSAPPSNPIFFDPRQKLVIVKKKREGERGTGQENEDRIDFTALSGGLQVYGEIEI